MWNFFAKFFWGILTEKKDIQYCENRICVTILLTCNLSLKKLLRKLQS